jgi:hypothetical protein
MLTIRKACPEDAPQLSAMGYASYQHHFAHLWRNADELALFLKQEYAEDALRRSLTDANHHWLIAEAASPVGFAKYSYQQRMADDGTMGTLLHKLYLMPGRLATATASRFFTPSRREQKRPVNAGCGWKYSPRIPPRAVFTNARGCSTSETRLSIPPASKAPYIFWPNRFERNYA